WPLWLSLGFSSRCRSVRSATERWRQALQNALSVTTSNPADAPVITLDGDSAAPAKPSPLVGVTAISVVPLPISRSPDLDTNTGCLEVYTLGQSRRRACDGHCANHSKCSEHSSNQHGVSFLLSVFGLNPNVCASFRGNIEPGLSGRRGSIFVV